MRDKATALAPEWQGLDADGRLILAFSRGRTVETLLAGDGRWRTTLRLDAMQERPVLEAWRSSQPEVLISTTFPAKREVIDGLLAHGVILLAEAAGDLVIPLFKVRLSSDELREVAWLKRELAAKELGLLLPTTDPKAGLGPRPEE